MGRYIIKNDKNDKREDGMTGSQWRAEDKLGSEKEMGKSECQPESRAREHKGQDRSREVKNAVPQSEPGSRLIYTPERNSTLLPNTITIRYISF